VCSFCSKVSSTFSGRPLCLVAAKSLVAFLVIPLAAFATSLLAGSSPFWAAWTIPMNRCCFLDTAGMATPYGFGNDWPDYNNPCRGYNL